jgi:hypothetical protein
MFAFYFFFFFKYLCVSSHVLSDIESDICVKELQEDDCDIASMKGTMWETMKEREMRANTT